MGSVLFQIDESGEENPLCYYSHKLNPAKRNYTVTEQECLAMALSMKRFPPYIEGTPFTIITDHIALRWLMNQKGLSGRLARWSLAL